MTKAEAMAAALNEFLDVSWEVEAAAVVSPDGLPMASALPPDVEEERLAAMSASLLTLGERAAEGLDKGSLAQVLVEGERGYVLLMSAGPDALLVAVTSHDAKVGLVLFEMRRAAQGIAAVMDGSYRQPPAPASGIESAAGDLPEPTLDELDESVNTSEPPAYPETIRAGEDETNPQPPPAPEAAEPASAPAVSDPSLEESGAAWTGTSDDLKVETPVQESSWTHPADASHEPAPWTDAAADASPEPVPWAPRTSDVSTSEPEGLGWQSPAEPAERERSSAPAGETVSSEFGEPTTQEEGRSLWDPASGGHGAPAEPEEEPEPPRGWRHWRSSSDDDSAEVSGTEEPAGDRTKWLDSPEHQDDNESSASAPNWK